MEERTGLPREPNDVPASENWEETKRQAQEAFIGSNENRITIDRIHLQRLLNAKFWENEILHGNLDLTRDEIEKQPDLDGPER